MTTPSLANLKNITIKNQTLLCWNEHLNHLSFCPQNPQPVFEASVIVIMVCILYAMTSLISIYGNTLVIWIVTTTKALKNVNNLFIANLALSDVTIALFCIPFQSYAALVQRWDLPEFMCKFCPMAQMASINVSIFTLIAIAKERYRAVINPMGLQTSRFEARIYLALIWIFSVLFAIPVGLAHVFTYRIDKQLGAKPFCSPYETTNLFSSNQMKGYDFYMLLMFGVQYAFPFAYLTSKYAAMAHCLWKTNVPPGNPDEDRDENILAQRKRSVKMMITVVTMFGICWLPWHAFHCARLIWPKMMKYEYINVVFFVSHWIAMSNSCLNPFIYAIFSEKFGKELAKKSVCSKLKCERCQVDNVVDNIELAEIQLHLFQEIPQ